MRFRTLPFLALLLFLLALAIPTEIMALGVPYHPPAVTLIATHGEKDLEITLTMHRKDGDYSVVLEKERRGWETHFRLYREAAWRINAWYGNSYDLKDAELKLVSGGKERVLVLPREITDQGNVNDAIMLNCKTGAMRFGTPVWRTPLHILIRVALGLLLEGLIFHRFGYRTKKSWQVFFLVNLVTLGFLNWMISGWMNVSTDVYLLYMLACLIIFSAEVLLFVIFLEEYNRDRVISFALIANVAGIALNLALMKMLPL